MAGGGMNSGHIRCCWTHNPTMKSCGTVPAEVSTELSIHQSPAGKRQRQQGIPDDVVGQILAHLSVKCLVRLRCVCKSWRRIINSPFFVRNLHLILHTSIRAKFPVFVSLNGGMTDELSWEFVFYSDDLVYIERKPVAAAIGSEFQINRVSAALAGTRLNSYSPHILDLCDGLLLFEVCCGVRMLWPSLHVVNPATGQILHLPLNYYTINLQDQLVIHDHHVKLFGKILFDQKSQHYKVLLFWCLSEIVSAAGLPLRLIRTFTFGASVFTIGGRRRWRHLDSPLVKNRVLEADNHNHHAANNAITNGAFHFCVSNTHENQYNTTFSIVAFDISSESLRAIVKPRCTNCYINTEDPDSPCHPLIKVEVIEGSLYYFHLNHHLTILEAWMLEDYYHAAEREAVWIKTSTWDVRDPLGVGLGEEESNYLSDHKRKTIRKHWIDSTIILGHPLVFVLCTGPRGLDMKAYYYDPKSRGKLQVKMANENFYEQYSRKIWSLPRKPFVETLVPIY